MKRAIESLINDIQYDVTGMLAGHGILCVTTVRDNIIHWPGRGNASSIPARFTMNMSLRYRNIAPDLVVDLVWRNVRFDQYWSTNLSTKIKNWNGKDTANKPIYQTVYAQSTATKRKVLNADANMNLIITDAENRRQLLAALGRIINFRYRPRTCRLWRRQNGHWSKRLGPHQPL